MKTAAPQAIWTGSQNKSCGGTIIGINATAPTGAK